MYQAFFFLYKVRVADRIVLFDQRLGSAGCLRIVAVGSL